MYRTSSSLVVVSCVMGLLLADASAQDADSKLPAIKNFDSALQLDALKRRLENQQLAHVDADGLEVILELILRQDFDAARIALGSLRAENPELPTFSALLIQMSKVADSRQTARTLLEKARADAPREPEIYLLLAADNFLEQQYVEAEMLAEHAIALVEQTPALARKIEFLTGCTEILAGVAAARGNYRSVCELVERASEAGLTSSSLEQNYARALFALRRRDAARTALERAVALDATLPNADILLAGFYVEQGEHAKAAAILRPLAVRPEISPADGVPMAKTFMAMQMLDEARRLLDRVLVAHRDHSDLLYLRACLARLDKDHELALRCLKEAFLALPSEFEIANALAEVVLESEDRAAHPWALRIAQANVRLHKSPQAYLTLAYARCRLGQINECVSLCDLLSKNDFDNPDDLYLLASIYFTTGEMQECRSILDGLLARKDTFLHREAAQALWDSLKQE